MHIFQKLQIFIEILNFGFEISGSFHLFFKVGAKVRFLSKSGWLRHTCTLCPKGFGLCLGAGRSASPFRDQCKVKSKSPQSCAWKLIPLHGPPERLSGTPGLCRWPLAALLSPGLTGLLILMAGLLNLLNESHQCRVS